MAVKTRFAPSPTGYLHVGGARTALYSWLYARHHQGCFVLRIEDTDLARSTPEATQAILDGMAWLGLEADEGPFYQTERMDRYQLLIERLLSEGSAYRCYCSKERLTALREEQTEKKEKPRYDGHCRSLPTDAAQEADYVIRFKNPTDGDVLIDDGVLGQIVIQNKELDDLIIARSDGSPTYNFTVVVDDLDMGITHVIRGNDHVNNTPRQINLFNALDAKLPHYAHVPMILGDDGKRLSKRHGAVSVLQYRDDGYLPQALLNYLVRLGWSHGDQEIFSLEEMIAHFNIDKLNKAPCTFNTEKLDWLNQQYMKTLPAEEVAEHLKWQFEQASISETDGPSLEAVVGAQCERVKTLKEMAERSRFWFEEFKEYEEKAARKNLTEAAIAPLKQMKAGLEALQEWTAEAIHQVIVDAGECLELKMGKIAQPVRVAVTGGTVSPSLDVTLALLGRDKTLARLDRAIAFIG